MDINIVNEPCACPPGKCRHFLEDDEICINRLTGDVRTFLCVPCKAHTWHQDGKCLSCGADLLTEAAALIKRLHRIERHPGWQSRAFQWLQKSPDSGDGKL